MCYFITIGMQQNKSAAATAVAPRGLRVQPRVNRSISQYLPKRVTTFVVTKHGCSCALFCEESEKPDEEEVIEKLRRKYQSRGWSPTKIERALAQHRADRRSPEPPYGLVPPVRSFLADLCNEVGELFVIVHWGTASERIELSEGPTISSGELRDANPVTRTDRVYRIVSQNKRKRTE